MALSRFKEPTALISFKGDVSQEVVNAISLICFVVQRKKQKEAGLLDEHIKKGKYGYTISHALLKAFSRTKGGDVRGLYRAFFELKNDDFTWNYFQQDKTFPSAHLERNMVIGLGVSLPEGEEEEYISYITGKGRREKKSLTGARKRKPRQDGLYVEIHPVFEEKIADPAVYAMLDILMIVACSDGRYFYQFYKIVANAWSTGYKTIDINWKDLRDSLHVQEGQYETYVSFKKRILKPCIKSCNDKSPYYVEPNVKVISRDGRRVGKIRLEISKQQWQLSLFDDYPDEAEAILKFLKEEGSLDRIEGDKQKPYKSKEEKIRNRSKEEIDFLDKVKSYESGCGVDEGVIWMSVERDGLDGAEDNLTYGLAQIAKGKDNPTGYLADCFRRGYGSKTPAERDEEAKKQVQLKEKQDEERKKRENKELDDYIIEFQRDKKEKLQIFFESFPETEQVKLIEKFRPTQSEFLRKKNAGNGLDNPGFSMIFFSWFEKQGLAEKEENFMEWVKREKGMEVEEDTRKDGEYRFKK